MTLRLKIVLALVLLATTATAAIGIVSYRTTANQLQIAVDRSLDTAASQVRLEPDHDDDSGLGRPRSIDQVLIQVIDPKGKVLNPQRAYSLPVTPDDLSVAAGGDAVRHNVDIGDETFRVLTVPSSVGAVQLARSLKEKEQSLDTILRRTTYAVIFVIVASALVGWFLGRRITRRLARLTAAAGLVASTGRLDVDVPVDGGDETAHLGRAFSGMLGALARSREQQQQLVENAGHELRTPLTSLRTNVSVLRHFESLEPQVRNQVISDLDSESKELTLLVNELVELATDRRDDEPMQPGTLGEVAERAATRLRRRTGREVVVTADATQLEFRPLALERAVQNLVDNAAKFAPTGPIEITATGTTLEVRDHGAALHEADIPNLFDRFFRAVEARSQPGSGLGLAIVKSVVEGHGGKTFARRAPDGGAVIGFTLPPPTR